MFVVAGMAVLTSIRNIAVPYWKANREASADTFGFLEERLAGTEDIRSNDAKPYVMLRFHELMRSWYGKALKAGLMSSIMFSTTMFMFGVGSAISLSLGAYLYFGGAISLGTVYLIFHFTQMLVMPINRFTQQLDSFQRASAAISRILELNAVRKTVLDPPVDGEGGCGREGCERGERSVVSPTWLEVGPRPRSFASLGTTWMG